MPKIYTTFQVGEILNTDGWRVRRLFEDGVIPEPARFAGKRAIPSELIPQIVDALRDKGWLPKAEATS
jgi:hypothetical protein